jgi:hypothetical protein
VLNTSGYQSEPQSTVTHTCGNTIIYTGTTTLDILPRPTKELLENMCQFLVVVALQEMLHITAVKKVFNKNNLLFSHDNN